jgi:hypothetical protein
MRRWSGTALVRFQFRLQQSVKKNDGAIRQAAITAFSVLLFSETSQPSGFFLKKKPPCKIPQ